MLCRSAAQEIAAAFDDFYFVNLASISRHPQDSALRAQIFDYTPAEASGFRALPPGNRCQRIAHAGLHRPTAADIDPGAPSQPAVEFFPVEQAVLNIGSDPGVPRECQCCAFEYSCPARSNHSVCRESRVENAAENQPISSAIAFGQPAAEGMPGTGNAVPAPIMMMMGVSPSAGSRKCDFDTYISRVRHPSSRSPRNPDAPPDSCDRWPDSGLRIRSGEPRLIFSLMRCDRIEPRLQWRSSSPSVSASGSAECQWQDPQTGGWRSSFLSALRSPAIPPQGLCVADLGPAWPRQKGAIASALFAAAAPPPVSPSSSETCDFAFQSDGTQKFLNQCRIICGIGCRARHQNA